MANAKQVPVVPLRAGGELPAVGLGTWLLRGRKGYDCVRAALDAGYRHIDTASMYGNEAEVGKAMRDSGIDRAEIFVTTKLRPTDAGKARPTLRAGLRALGTGYVDLWLIHWPPRAKAARAELWAEFLAVREEGLCRHAGVSNFSVGQLDEVTSAAGEAPEVNQIHWNPARFDAAALAGHRERGVVLEGYSPLKDTDLRDPALTKIAGQHEVTPAQVVLRWHIQHQTPVIPRSGDRGRIAANIDLFGFELDDAEMSAIDALGR
jgi:2,5-diketo-D-gluconate reductase A